MVVPPVVHALGAVPVLMPHAVAPPPFPVLYIAVVVVTTVGVLTIRGLVLTVIGLVLIAAIVAMVILRKSRPCQQRERKCGEDGGFAKSIHGCYLYTL